MTLPNIIAAGIYDSQIAAKNTAISKKRKTTMFEIELPLENGGISYIDSESVNITPDMLICAKPNQIRHTKFPFKCMYIHMIVPDGNLADILLNAQIFLATKNRDRYEKVFTKIVKYSNLISENEKIILQSLVLELIYLISKEKTANTYTGKSKNTATVIENSIKYINEHITEDLSLETLSSKMSLSPIYFHKIFKSSTGRKLRDYVEEQRIKKSIHLLQTTDYTLTRIAYECGFSSQSYFSYVFKRRMSDTPRDYIKKLYDKYEI